MVLISNQKTEKKKTQEKIITRNLKGNFELVHLKPDIVLKTLKEITYAY